MQNKPLVLVSRGIPQCLIPTILHQQAHRIIQLNNPRAEGNVLPLQVLEFLIHLQFLLWGVPDAVFVFIFFAFGLKMYF